MTLCTNIITIVCQLGGLAFYVEIQVISQTNNQNQVNNCLYTRHLQLYVERFLNNEWFVTCLFFLNTLQLLFCLGKFVQASVVETNFE